MTNHLREEPLQYTTEWNTLADIKDELASKDWFPGTSGNLSIKVSDEPFSFLVTASGKDKYKRTAEDFLLVGDDCQPVEETSLKPSAETIIHRDLYQYTDARCVLHVHTIANNVISEIYGDQGEILFKGQELIKAFGMWEEDAELIVPIVENYAHIPNLSDEIINRRHPNTPGVLIRNHGITAWGDTPFAAKRHLQAFEFLFSYHLQLLQLKGRG